MLSKIKNIVFSHDIYGIAKSLIWTSVKIEVKMNLLDRITQFRYYIQLFVDTQ